MKRDITPGYLIAIVLLLMLAGIALSLLTGCTAPLTGGTVYDKIFTPAHVEQASYEVPVREYKYVYDHDDGEYQWKWVTYNVTKWTSVEVPDIYTVFIKGFNKDDKPLTEQHEVSKDAYDGIKIGDWFAVPKEAPAHE